VAPTGVTEPVLSDVSFGLVAGQGLGIIGPSGTGKSTLARAIAGILPPIHGTVRFDGAKLHQWERERLAAAVGYLPQSVELIDGTIAENIARFSPDATSEGVIAAARNAGAHDLIVNLPQGYETQVGRDGARLSAGQSQRIGLARALYGNPFLVLLDEPNSNLDHDGELALNAAIAGVRSRGGIVIVIAHRPSLLAEVSHVLFLRNGTVEAFGPRDQVLGKILRPAEPANLPGTVKAQVSAVA
jgi:ATP-binding cassette subfamily C protein